MNSEAVEMVKRHSGLQKVTYASNLTTTDENEHKKHFSVPVLEKPRDSQQDPPEPIEYK